MLFREVFTPLVAVTGTCLVTALATCLWPVKPEPVEGTVASERPILLINEPIQPVLGVVVKTGFGFRLFGINNRIVAGQTLNEVSTEAVITCQFDRMPLMPGTYYLDLYLGDPFGDIDVVTDAISFEVFPSDVFGTGRLPPQLAGPLFLSAHWTLKDTALSPSFAIGTSNV